jgi:acyl-CoA dehydrogenase
MHGVILTEELIRSGSPGLAASLGSLGIALPPIINAGTEEQKRRWIPKVLSGEWIAALAITEPGTGSDVASIRTRAVKDGDEYVINGSKTFITSGTRADLITLAVRTGGEGMEGVSLIGVETDRTGFSVANKLEKMGWAASDTGELVFEDMRVPADCLIGELNGGFIVMMQNFGSERIFLAAMAVEIAQMAFDEARRYSQEREVFGRPIGKFQVTRHKLAEMATGLDVDAGDVRIQEVAMAKNATVDMAMRVVDQAVQIHGGYGYMREYLVERLYRDIRLYPIGGGTREIMNEIISRHL